MAIVYLSLGSNKGDRIGYVQQATSLLGACENISIIRTSAFYETEPWGFDSCHAFVNAVVCCRTALTPRGVLLETQAIERALGRTHKSEGGHYADRTVDIDILLYDDISVDEPDLKIPHPLMRQRDFVMVPLGEIMG